MNATTFILVCGLLCAAAFTGGYIFGSKGFDEANALERRKYDALLSGQRDLRDRLDALSAQKSVKFSDVVAAQRKESGKKTKDYPVCPICGKRVDGWLAHPTILENYYVALPCNHVVRAVDMPRCNATKYECDGEND